MMRTTLVRVAFGLTVLAAPVAAPAATLITESEAALPAAAGGVTMRGITRGPTI